MQKRLTWWLLLVCPVAAQTPMTLQQAVKIALEKHPSVEAAGARLKGAQERITQARAGYLPRLNYNESFARSDNPVFVFSSLLTQRRFTERNFAIPSLNRPDFLNNFQSQLSVEQTVWDGGLTRANVKAAELGQAISSEDDRRTRLATVSRVIATYFAVQYASKTLDSAREALRSAEADLERAQTVRQAGMSTDADVLSIRVHVAAMRQEEIRRAADLQVASAALNEALGLPLETPHELATPLQSAPPAATAVGEFLQRAAEHRPELQQARLGLEAAQVQTGAARAALWPQVGVRGVFEADRQQFVNKGGANWLLAASLRWNLFNGGADRSRIAEAEQAAAASRADLRRAETGVQLEVRRAWANLDAANSQLAVAAAAVEMAAESLRITKNRYNAGLATVTDLLRTETSLDQARTRSLGAAYEQRMAAAALEAAAGTLSESSEVLK